jgi:hypothetical protein
MRVVAMTRAGDAVGVGPGRRLLNAPAGLVLRLLLAFGLVSGCMVGGMIPAWGASPAQLDLCYRTFPMVDWRTTCFLPRQAGAAARDAALTPLLPRQVAWRDTGLSLRFIAVLTFSGRHSSVNYLYGRVAPGGGFPATADPGDDYVMITEAAGRLARSTFVFYRAASRGLWRLQANVPGRSLVVTIQSTEGRTPDRRIALALVGGSSPS